MHKMIVVLALTALAVLLALAIFVQRATPGPESHDILGVGIGTYSSDAGVAYLSGRRLIGRAAEAIPNLTTSGLLRRSGSQ